MSVKDSSLSHAKDIDIKLVVPSQEVRIRPVSSTYPLTPKSVNFTSPLVFNNTFAGLMSR